MSITVLLIANDKAATTNLGAAFNKKDYTVLAAHSGRQALAQNKAHHPDAIILDATAPHLNWLKICRALRAESPALILLLGPSNLKIEKRSADLLFSKNLPPKKIAARLKTALDARPPRLMTFGHLTLDLEKKRVGRGSKMHALTPKEFDLLKLFISRPGQVVTRKVLMKEVWETDYMGDTRTLDVHIRWLREKIEENPSKPQYLITVRRQGYRLEVRK
jgi:DNA-binding response OmpR family regulator